MVASSLDDCAATGAVAAIRIMAAANALEALIYGRDPSLCSGWQESLNLRLLLDELNRQAVGIFDHEGSPIAERVRLFDDSHAGSTQTREKRVELFDRECDVVER